ncbi:MAG: RHS repeat-associated core domain-containing protein, partial [Kineosporiaceae bacterium]
VTTPDHGAWTYLYDPLGRRIAKQRSDPDPNTGAPLDQVLFTWDGNTTIEQHDATGTTTWIYHPVTGTPLAQHTTPHNPAHHDPASPGGVGGWTQEEFDQRFQAIITDLVDAPTALITTTGHHTWHQPTTTWGTPTTSPTATLAGTECPLRFPGQHHDPETGLHYNHHRYYDPTTARYLTPDPLGLTPAPNPHTYVPNPTHETDPLGLVPGYGNDANGAPDGQWFPKRELPRNKHGVPISDSSYPHTQLGQKSGRKGDYPQAREFGPGGEPVRDIDFTDHGRPGSHSNPHQYSWLPNETGGTPRRGPTEPFQ